jgi:hypothetical protein
VGSVDLEAKALRAAGLSLMRAGVNAVVQGQMDEYKSDLVSAADVMGHLGMEVYQCEMESNGWQMDFWIDVPIDGRILVVGGEGYRGACV